MNKIKQVIEFFNNVPVGSFITRKMYMDVMKSEDLSVNLLDNYRCLLQRNGYINDNELKNKGVYYIQKHIPNNITTSKLTLKAYGIKIKFTMNSDITRIG